MTDREALAALAAQGDKSTQDNQSILARLQRLGWILCDDITTLDSTDARVLAFIEVTEAGQKILERRSR